MLEKNNKYIEYNTSDIYSIYLLNYILYKD